MPVIDQTLFPLPEPLPAPPAAPTRPGEARVVRPNRLQTEWLPLNLDEALADDHPARAVWDMVSRLNLDGFYARIKAVLDGPGRPTTDPQVLFAVWSLGVLDGVGSARQLARLCDQHLAYRWLCGGAPINYHMLSDFRVAHLAELDELLTQTVARLQYAGAVPLETVAQDGMRVRASVGAGSYRRRESLEQYVEQMREEVGRLAEEREHPDPGLSKRQVAARERAARERRERIEAAMATMPEVEATKEAQAKHLSRERRKRVSAPRVSTTDAETRVMKMADGGFRPAGNVQIVTDGAKGIVVGVAVTNVGSDGGQALPMLEQVERRTGETPRNYLMDGGFSSLGDITELTQRGVTVYTPPRQPKWKADAERYEWHWGDTPEVTAWRRRMGTDEGKATYRQRAAIAEWANAQFVQHGLRRFTVRGLEKMTSVVLLVAIVHNLARWMTL